MSDYVSRQYLLNEYDRQHQGPPGVARKIIAEAPAEDVVQVRHGKWIDMGDHGDWQWQTGGRGNCWHLWKCDICDGKVKIKSDFCPNCGAKMDKE